jgi:dipeptidyl aminopeptidase/acylaminoacyl peptidase
MSHDTGEGVDDWRVLAAAIAPRSPRLSPRGDLAYVATDDPAVGGRIRIVRAEHGAMGDIERRAPTDEQRSEHTPRWSPGGRRLAFVAAGPELDAVDVVSADGPACTAISAGGGWRVDELQWIDEDCLAAIVAPRNSDSAVGLGALRGAPGSGPMVWENRSGRRRLAIVDLLAGRLDLLETGAATVWEVCPLDRRRFVAIVSDEPTESGWYRARLSLLDVAGSERVLHEPDWQIAAPRRSPDGIRIALVEGWASDRGYVAGDVVVVDLVERESTAWSVDGVDVVGLDWLDSERLRFHGWSRTRSAHGVARVDGTVASVVVDDDVLRDQTAGPGPAAPPAAAVMERAGAPARVVVATDEGGWRPADAPSPGRAIDLRVDDISWTAADGTAVEGLLLTRRDLDRRRCPPVAAIHGGPANLWTRAASVGAAALASSGYAVILPNPRGSVGRGQAFARANLGDPAGRELDDALGAVTTCREQGLVLDRPPGIVGGSYGGYLTAAAAVFRHDIAAAVVMYGHPDLISARFGSNNPDFYDILLGGSPGDGTLPLYIERSPVLHAHGDVAPTLILHGDGDRCTPVGQADELFRALLDHDVPSELVVYPGEGHGLRSPAAQLDAWARTIAWFDRHISDQGAR